MNDIPTIISNTIDKIVWPILFGSVVIMVIFSGIMFIIAAGDPLKIITAKKALLYAIVGLIIGVLAFSAEKILKDIIG